MFLLYTQKALGFTRFFIAFRSFLDGAPRGRPVRVYIIFRQLLAPDSAENSAIIENFVKFRLVVDHNKVHID